MILDDVSSELQRSGELTVVNGEVAWKHNESLHLLRPCHLSVQTVDCLGDGRAYLRAVGRWLRETELGGEGCSSFRFQGHQGGEVFAAVTDDDCL